eukprot:352075-Chlamydomonas_euryale.AAC.2
MPNIHDVQTSSAARVGKGTERVLKPLRGWSATEEVGRPPFSVDHRNHTTVIYGLRPACATRAATLHVPRAQFYARHDPEIPDAYLWAQLAQKHTKVLLGGGNKLFVVMPEQGERGEHARCFVSPEPIGTGSLGRRLRQRIAAAAAAAAACMRLGA